MNVLTVLVGVTAILYGLYSAWARKARPHQFRKLEPMKKAFGERGGLLLHMFGYTVVPIAAGIVFIYNGLAGHALF